MKLLFILKKIYTFLVVGLQITGMSTPLTKRSKGSLLLAALYQHRLFKDSLS